MTTPVLGTKGAEMDLMIRQGATLGPIYVWMEDADNSPMDITGAVVRAHIRRRADRSLVPGAEAVIELTDAPNGAFTWEFAAADTANLDADPSSADAELSRYYWDMEIEFSDGRVVPLCHGAVRVYREITREGQS